MAEFTLPKNSKVEKGKTIAAAEGAKNKKVFHVFYIFKVNYKSRSKKRFLYK